jgi:hypothetical protein
MDNINNANNSNRMMNNFGIDGSMNESNSNQQQPFRTLFP